MSIEESLKEKKRLHNQKVSEKRKARRLADKLAKDPHHLTPTQLDLVSKQAYKKIDKLVDRECLKCDREFQARGKFVRICRGCTANNNKNWRESAC